MSFGADQRRDCDVESRRSRNPLKFESGSAEVGNAKIFEGVEFWKSDRVNGFHSVVENREDSAEWFGSRSKCQRPNERNRAGQTCSNGCVLRWSGDDWKLEMHVVEFGVADASSVFGVHGMTTTIVDGVCCKDCATRVAEKMRTRQLAREETSADHGR